MTREAERLLRKIASIPIFICKIRNKFNPIVIPTFSKLNMINVPGRFSALKPKRGIDQIVSRTIIIPMMDIKDGSWTPRMMGDKKLRHPCHTKKNGIPVINSDVITFVKIALDRKSVV